MSEDYGKYDLLQLAGLRPKPVDKEKKRYGGFNRRMLAASIDSLIIALTIGPLVDYLFTLIYGPPIDMPDLSQRLNGITDLSEAVRVFIAGLDRSGFLDRWMINMEWQTFALFLYTTLCWHYWSATLGKIILRLKIVDATTGAPITHLQGMIRIFSYGISAVPLGLGYFWMCFDKKKRGWHDLLADTVVIVVPWRKEPLIPVPESVLPLNSPVPSPGE